MNLGRPYPSPNRSQVLHLYSCRGDEEANGDNEKGGYFTHAICFSVNSSVTTRGLIEAARRMVRGQVGTKQNPGLYAYGPVDYDKPFVSALKKIQRILVVAVHYDGDLHIEGVRNDVFNLFDRFGNYWPNDVKGTVFLAGGPLHSFGFFSNVKHLQPEPKAIREHVQALYRSHGNALLAFFGHGVNTRQGEGLLLAPRSLFQSEDVLEDSLLAQLQVERMTRPGGGGDLMLLVDTCKSGEAPSPKDVLKKTRQARSAPQVLADLSGSFVDTAQIVNEVCNGYYQYAATLFCGLSYGFLALLITSMFFALAWAFCVMRNELGQIIVAGVCATVMGLVAEFILSPTLAHYGIAVHDRAFLGVFAFFVALSAILCCCMTCFREIRSAQQMQAVWRGVSSAIQLRSLTLVMMRFYIFGGGEVHPQGVRCGDGEAAFYHPMHNGTDCLIPMRQRRHMRLSEDLNHSLMLERSLVTCNFTIFKSRVQSMIGEGRRPVAFYIGNTAFDLSSIDDGSDIVQKLTSGAPPLDFVSLRRDHADSAQINGKPITLEFAEIPPHSVLSLDGLGFMAFKTLAILSDEVNRLIAFAGTQRGFACIVGGAVLCGVAVAQTTPVRKTVQAADSVTKAITNSVGKAAGRAEAVALAVIQSIRDDDNASPKIQAGPVMQI